jgi:hypothetical protein
MDVLLRCAVRRVGTGALAVALLVFGFGASWASASAPFCDTSSQTCVGEWEDGTCSYDGFSTARENDVAFGQRCGTSRNALAVYAVESTPVWGSTFAGVEWYSCTGCGSTSGPYNSTEIGIGPAGPYTVQWYTGPNGCVIDTYPQNFREPCVVGGPPNPPDVPWGTFLP